jgi:hypothetical protein
VSAQLEFDTKYVSSTELCRDLGVTRASIVNRRRVGGLPDPVVINRPDGSPHVVLWVRSAIAPHLERWRAELAERRT